MKIRMKKLLCLVLFLILLHSCASGKFRGLKNGDLIFVTANAENLSGAISRVTKTGAKFSYDHLGLIEKSGREYFVYHAAPKGGSQRQPLKDFVDEAGKERQQLVIYRLKPQYQHAIPQALENAKAMLGKPYNFSYVLNEESYYCSDFVERAFRGNGIFELQPMTFINPKTGKTDDYWKKFYDRLGIPVPEGEPGCNPNGMANSEKIFFVRVLEF
ncbi:Permuted papain-like amidase enzyme, YaeF/YiiX, C92 family [Cruoricaptor ignavus]|uniref:Permuted papain-like amidase enzyme, YaeF/YiiX, C92 family n=2 Tax=Cruoricaptor ignavus TaxID=1118202 RepID=A0A1M6A3H6_9FLAO|nr:Permuted papain-like amidase enzyme, YaeF/YiiX, C92 family [Cruoricaptor ignavus]